MDEIEISCPDIKRIVNTVFVELTRRMVSVEMWPKESFQTLSSIRYCFEIRTEGAFFSLILFEMEEKVYEKIAATLNKGASSAQEKKQSVTEYLNVVCGRILSEINNGLGKRSKLSVPLSIECEEEDGCFQSRLELSYACPDGHLNIIICFDCE